MLTDRQIQLLATIIKEYIDSSEPVGSIELVKKYNLSFSPATVRNEMSHLLDEGFLGMVHTSSGRVPTSMAYKYFLEELMEEEEVPVLHEIAMKQKLWPNRFEYERLLRNAVLSLADITKELSIACTSDGHVVHAGAVNVLDNKEFWDINVAKAALNLLDNNELLDNIFAKADFGSNEVKCIIGEDIGYENLENCAIVIAQYKAGERSGNVGVIGPARMNYSKIIPAVRYTKNLLEELTGSW
jgi:heat-inducible transcriptional repressor